MSDGERVALYLIARVLTAPDGLIFVDEPELHLHSLVARCLWDCLESERFECRFVYITHDIPFAMSRRDATFVVFRSTSDIEIVKNASELPSTVFGDIIGIATLGVASSRIIFCEGTRSGQDELLYHALLHRYGCEVIPVESCMEVARCVSAMQNEKIVKNACVIGITDRDHLHPEKIEGKKSNHLFVLDVHEVDSLYVLKPCFETVRRHLSVENIKSTYENFIQSAKERLRKDIPRVVVDRVKQRIYDSLARHLGKVQCDSLENAKSSIEDTLKNRQDNLNFDAIWIEESDLVTLSLNDSAQNLLRIFPGKDLVGIAASLLGVSSSRYKSLLRNLVKNASDGEQLIKDLTTSIGLPANLEELFSNQRTE